jgi:MinD superfamily P-loop ATPase
LNIAVLSGKGGTGKTTISLGLFSLLKNASLIDTDIEEPNDHLFIDYTKTKTTSITKQYPVINSDTCSLCGRCGDFCNFNSLLVTKKKVMVFDDLCHDCGGCKLVCPNESITYTDKEIGQLYEGHTKSQQSFLYGDLNIGEVSGVKLIQALKDKVKNDDFVIIDSPPGTSCATVEAVSNSDYAIVVTEPTPFGLSDMEMVVEMLNDLKIPFGIIINKAGLGNRDMYRYITDNKLTLLGEIPFSKEYASIYSKGKIMVNENPQYKEKLETIIDRLMGEIHA